MKGRRFQRGMLKIHFAPRKKMTLVLALAVNDGVVLAGDRRIGDAAGHCIDIPGIKVFNVHSRFGVASYGGYPSEDGGFPHHMRIFEPPASQQTHDLADALLRRFVEPQDPTRNTVRMLVAGPDRQVFRVVAAEGRVEQLNSSGTVGVWCGTLADWGGGENPTALPGWPAGRDPALLASTLSLKEAARLATDLIQRASLTLPTRIGPDADFLILTQDGARAR